MKHASLAIVLVATLALSTPAWAQGQGHGQGNGNGHGPSENGGGPGNGNGPGNAGGLGNGPGPGPAGPASGVGPGNAGGPGVPGAPGGPGNAGGVGIPGDPVPPGPTDIVKGPAIAGPANALPPPVGELSESDALAAVEAGRAVELATILPDVRSRTGGEVINARLQQVGGFLIYAVTALTPEGQVVTEHYYARSGIHVAR